MKGKIKFMNQKGYGFIIADDNKEYFVHINQTQGIIFDKDVEVSFTPKETQKGLQAMNVMAI